MERHGHPSAHVYTLPSSRLKGGVITTEASGSISYTKPSGSGHQGPLRTPPATPRPFQNSVSAGNSPRTEFAPSTISAEATVGRLFPPTTSRNYRCDNWSLVSLTRSSIGRRSAPTTPTTAEPPPIPGTAAGSSSAPYIIATLLHLPTQILYAWPIALKESASGQCVVTQPEKSPASAQGYDDRAVLSESIKVLADVIRAWVKTQPMRESLRRKESRRAKGIRKIGENQQDAIWLNEGLGLSELTEEARRDAMRRTWQGDGQDMPPESPPATISPVQVTVALPQSPSRSVISLSPLQDSPSPSTKGATSPSRAKADDLVPILKKASLAALTSSSSSTGSSSAAAAAAAPPSVDEISSVESISRPTTPRISVQEPDSPVPYEIQPPSVLPISGSAQEAAIEAEIHNWIQTGSLADFTRPKTVISAGSPTARARKSVTFNEATVIAVPRASYYKPPFAPTAEPPLQDEIPPLSLAQSPHVASAELGSPPRLTVELKGSQRRASEELSRPMNTIQRTSTNISQRSHSAENVMSPSSPMLSPEMSAYNRHRRSQSKLSQEIHREDLDDPKGKSASRMSPVHSLDNLKNALRAFKPSISSRKKVSPT